MGIKFRVRGCLPEGQRKKELIRHTPLERAGCCFSRASAAPFLWKQKVVDKIAVLVVLVDLHGSQTTIHTRLANVGRSMPGRDRGGRRGEVRVLGRTNG